MLPGILFFGLMALIVVGTAIGMVASRNAVYSALFLVLNFATVALLYLMLGAPFIALVQITVYAGSIMVLFIFVIMLLGAERLGVSHPPRGQQHACHRIRHYLAGRSQFILLDACPIDGSGRPAVGRGRQSFRGRNGALYRLCPAFPGDWLLTGRCHGRRHSPDARG
jgi:hypothetical protein